MKEFWMNTASHAMAGFDFMVVLYWFLASIALLVILRKTGLLRRNAKWHQLLVCLYYFYIPIVFIGCGALWSSVHSIDYTMRQSLTAARADIIQSSVDYTGSAWKKVLSVFNKNPGISPKDMCLTLTREYAGEIMGDLNASKYTMFLEPIVSGVKAGLQEGVAVSLAKLLEEKVISSISDSTRLDKELLKTLWSRDIVEAMRGGFVFDLIFNQVQRVVAPFYAKVKMLFAALMLPVVLEILLALYLRRRSKVA